jgi:hypothetical protein
VARAAAAAAAAALRLSAAALRARASGPVGLSGVIFAKAAPAVALLAACKLTSSVRSAKALVCQFGKHAVRICARLSALGEAEEAQSSTGGLLRRCVGAMTRSDEGNRCRLLCR